MVLIGPLNQFRTIQPSAKLSCYVDDLGPQLLGHTSFNLALKRVPPSAVALALLAEPIGSTVLAYLVLAEAPAPALYLGAGIILAGIALAVWPRYRSGPDVAVAR